MSNMNVHPDTSSVYATNAERLKMENEANKEKTGSTRATLCQGRDGDKAVFPLQCWKYEPMPEK